MTDLRFPADFLWGTASSSHQTEGNNRNNQWWPFEQQAGAIRNGDRSGLACDWWNNAEQDFDLMQQFDLNAHRLSIEWSRVEPRPGQFSSEALDRYRAMVGGLRDRGIRPFVNFFHFTNPIWIEESGGWENPETVIRFQQYVRVVTLALRDVCSDWMTLNEPLVYVGQGWFRADWPPKHPYPLAAMRAFRHLLLAHAAAYGTIHSLQPDANVGYAKAVRLFSGARPGHHPDRLAAGLKRYLFEHIWFMATLDGHIRPPVGVGEFHAGLANSCDYLGVNYYSRNVVRFTPNPRKLFGTEELIPEGGFSDSSSSGPYSSYQPDGLHQICMELRRFGKPIYIAENGLPDADDALRPRWLLGHLYHIHRAIQDGCDVRGYFHWTFVDNFEWSEGWSLRFGLVELDTETQKRRPRPSAHLYSTVARNNAISPPTVAEYAPELSAELFGTDSA